MKELWQSVNKIHFTNFALGFGLVFAILFTFVIQFRVEFLQDQIQKTESEISHYQDEIQLLEVEWVYLTRPERLRSLSAQYLQDNNYVLANQIKNSDQLAKYYMVNYQKNQDQSQQIGEEFNPESEQQVSF